jgi:hypothetical protein
MFPNPTTTKNDGKSDKRKNIFYGSLTIILSQFGMARPGKTPKQTNFLVKNNIKLKHFVFSNEIVAGEHINSFGVLVFLYFFHRFNLEHY